MPEQEKYNVICHLGRLGDIVTSEPVYRALASAHPDRKTVWITKAEYADIMRFCPYISEIRTVKNKDGYYSMKASFPEGTLFHEINFNAPHGRPAPDKYISKTPTLLNDIQDEMNLPRSNEPSKVYIDPKEPLPQGLPEKYVVFHCCSFGRERQWKRSNWTRLAEVFTSSGIGVVEIGFGALVKSASPLYCDMTGNRSIHSTMRIIEHTSALVGVESSMLHIANALDVFGFILSGSYGDRDEYDHHNGRYRTENCNMLRLYGINSMRLPFGLVKEAVSRFIAGHPFTRPQCAEYCLKYEIDALRRRPLIRFAEALRRPFDHIAAVLQFHRRPGRK